MMDGRKEVVVDEHLALKVSSVVEEGDIVDVKPLLTTVLQVLLRELKK